MKIKVGKSYKDRYGCVNECIKITKDKVICRETYSVFGKTSFPIWGYTLEGKFNLSGEESVYDLIEEVKL